MTDEIVIKYSQINLVNRNILHTFAKAIGYLRRVHGVKTIGKSYDDCYTLRLTYWIVAGPS